MGTNFLWWRHTLSVNFSGTWEFNLLNAFYGFSRRFLNRFFWLRIFFLSWLRTVGLLKIFLWKLLKQTNNRNSSDIVYNDVEDSSQIFQTIACLNVFEWFFGVEINKFWFSLRFFWDFNLRSNIIYNPIFRLIWNFIKH